MQIKVMSDLHFEFHADGGQGFLEQQYTDRTDVLVIAGDLSNFAHLSDSVAKVCKAFAKALVLFVPGNHEFYGSGIPQTLQTLAELSRQHANFKFLYNGRLVYKGVKFFGTTLWFRHAPDIEDLYPLMNDFYYIENFADHVYGQNKAAEDFLWHADMTGAIVITHMLPTKKSIAPKFLDDALNDFFVCEVDDIITSKSPAYWIHGHSHRSADYMLGKTRVLANPMGYVRRDCNLDFNYDLIITI